MDTATWLLTGFLLWAPPGEIDTVAGPRLEKGLEIIWKGRFNEAILHPSKSFRNYDIEIRALVIDVSEKGSDVGIMTSLSYTPEGKANLNSIKPLPIVRLEVIRIDPRGHVSLIPAAALSQPPEKRATVPVPIEYLQGLPALEVGMFLALPAGKLQAKQAWNTMEENRPPRSWKLDSVENVRAAHCLKVVGQQQTVGFERVSISRPQWRRTDTVWISDRTGYATKVERNIEKRSPDGGQLSFRSKLVYEQKGKEVYHDPLFTVQKEEIVIAATFGAELQQLLDDERKADSQSFAQIVKQIVQHEQSHLRGEYFPYRAAIAAIRRRAEAAKNGHIPPALPPAETDDPSTLEVGSPAPDFVTTELGQKTQVRLSRLQGKPIVLLYYQPSRKGAELVLKLAQSLFSGNSRKAYIMSVAVGDPDQACKQRDDWKLNLPILAGREVYKLHGVTSTPEIAILDENGVVRKVFVGWTDETADSVRKELEKWVK